MVGLGRVELPTSPLSGVRSNQLSYRPASRAPPPMSCRRLAQISFNANGFRGQRLNMLSSYATHDYRKNFGQEKKACIVFSAPANESAETEWMVTYPIAEATPQSRKK